MAKTTEELVAEARAACHKAEEWVAEEDMCPRCHQTMFATIDHSEVDGLCRDCTCLEHDELLRHLQALLVIYDALVEKNAVICWHCGELGATVVLPNQHYVHKDCAQLYLESK